MTHQATIQKVSTRAVAYARVSSPAQVKRGHGLSSQEVRCSDFAKHKGWQIEANFRDEGTTGSIIDRPGMQAMLTYLRDHAADEPIYVIIDDISRLARGLDAHLQLRAAIAEAGGDLKSPSIEFGEDSDSLLVENLLASVSQHARQKNTEQVVNRMKARVMQGYYVFGPPVGYSYDSVEGHGKMLVPDENAPAIIAALEGFAGGRFQTMSEVSRFLNSQKLVRQGRIYAAGNQTARDILERPIYAGYLTLEKWGLHLHPCKHEPLISFATWQKIQERLNGRSNAPQRADLHEDFPLRNFVTCHACDEPMSAAWSKGRSKRYGYFFCKTKGCAEHRKSIRKEAVEEEFDALLRSIQPIPSLFQVARAMFVDLWDKRLEMVRSDRSRVEARIAKLEAKMATLTDRLLNTDSDTLVSAYESQIKRLEVERIGLRDHAGKTAEPLRPFDEVFRTACNFLANPWKLWASDNYAHKRLVLRLAFPSTLPYCRNEGFRTAETTLPFKYLGGFCAGSSRMVEAMIKI